MVPDMKFAAEKIKTKFPAIIHRAGWALALVIAVMYAALGLVGFLIFLFGILTLVLIQAAILIRYIANENKRVQEREVDKDFDIHEDVNPLDDDNLSQFNDIDKYSESSFKVKPLAAKNSESQALEQSRKRKTVAVKFSDMPLDFAKSARFRDSEEFDLSTG